MIIVLRVDFNSLVLIDYNCKLSVLIGPHPDKTLDFSGSRRDQARTRKPKMRYLFMIDKSSSFRQWNSDLGCPQSNAYNMVKNTTVYH